MDGRNTQRLGGVGDGEYSALRYRVKLIDVVEDDVVVAGQDVGQAVGIWATATKQGCGYILYGNAHQCRTDQGNQRPGGTMGIQDADL